MATVGDIVTYLEELFPRDWAEDWDKVGLVAGDRSWPVHGLRLALDPTVFEANEAARHEGTMLITHHPLLLRGASFVSADTGKGTVLTSLLTSKGALWCGHTNVDRSTHGTIGAWTRLLALANVEPLSGAAPSPVNTELGMVGLGARGELPHETTVGELASLIARHVPATAQGVLFTGDEARPVRSVGVCPGAGDSFLADACRADVDVYITSDLRHHPALEHVESTGDPLDVPALIDLPHFASESLYFAHLADLLRAEFPSLPVEVSSHSSDPFTGRRTAKS